MNKFDRFSISPLTAWLVIRLVRFGIHKISSSVCLCLQDNLVDEVADLNTVPNEKQQHDITAGISNSFGFGGHNSVVAFAPFKQ